MALYKCVYYYYYVLNLTIKLLFQPTHAVIKCVLTHDWWRLQNPTRLHHHLSTNLSEKRGNKPRSCCSNVVITLTASCNIVNLVSVWADPVCSDIIWPSSLIASLMSRTRNLQHDISRLTPRLNAMLLLQLHLLAYFKSLNHCCLLTRKWTSTALPRPAVTLTFDLQNLTRSSVGASEYSL